MPVVFTDPRSATIHAEELHFAMLTPSRATTFKAPILNLPVLTYRLALDSGIEPSIKTIWLSIARYIKLGNLDIHTPYVADPSANLCLSCDV